MSSQQIIEKILGFIFNPRTWFNLGYSLFIISLFYVSIASLHYIVYVMEDLLLAREYLMIIGLMFFCFIIASIIYLIKFINKKGSEIKEVSKR